MVIWECETRNLELLQKKLIHFYISLRTTVSFSNVRRIVRLAVLQLLSTFHGGVKIKAEKVFE